MTQTIKTNWTRFDIKDRSTWPPELEMVCTDQGMGWLFYPIDNDDGWMFYSINNDECWQELEWETTNDGVSYMTGLHVTYWRPYEFGPEESE